jgi:hypothetical protein
VSAVTDSVHRLDLRVDVEDAHRIDSGHPDLPFLTILIDGQDVLAGIRPSGYIGFDPEAILGRASPLLPSGDSRRAAVYRCAGCRDPGCGVVAPLISESNGRILWTDFRDYTAVFIGPAQWVSEERLNGGTPLGLPAMWFDSSQYRAEVERASADDSWETERRRTARLLIEHLLRERGTLERHGYRLADAGPKFDEPSSYCVSLRKGEAQIVVELRAERGNPEKSAAAMAEELLRTRPEEWRVVWSHPHAYPRHDTYFAHFGRPLDPLR